MMQILNIVIFVLGIVGTILTIILGVISVQDFLVSRKITKSKKSSLPILIRKSLNFKQYHKAIKFIKELLDEDRFMPDLIVGVHYSGTELAAQIGKELYVPIFTAVIHYDMQNNAHICDRVYFNFNATDIFKDKKILIVDNGAISGLTLKMAFDEVSKYSHNIRTLVLFQKTEEEIQLIKPNFIIFKAKKRIELVR